MSSSNRFTQILSHLRLLVLISGLLFVGVYPSAAWSKTQASNLSHYDVNTAQGKRTYWLYVPKSLPEKAIPVVLVFHGFRITPLQMAAMTQWNPLADTRHFLVAYPQGVNLSWHGKGVPDENDADLRYTEAVLDDIAARYGIDQHRQYAVGFSNGAFFVHRLACELPGRFAAYASVAGTMGVPLSQTCRKTLKNPAPMLMINGKADPVVTWQGQIKRIKWFFRTSRILSVPNTIRFWQEVNQCEPISENLLFGHVKKPIGRFGKNARTSLEKRTYQCPANVAVLQWIVYGGGHTWPGMPTSAGFTRLLIGPTSQELNATKTIWDFFQPFSVKDSALQ